VGVFAAGAQRHTDAIRVDGDVQFQRQIADLGLTGASEIPAPVTSSLAENPSSAAISSTLRP
jgi:hypothetical protein